MGKKEEKMAGDQSKKSVDPFDGRMTYEAEVGESIELEVEDGSYQRFICMDGRDCKHCDFNFLSFDYCINFPCLADDRQDKKDVHFVWEDPCD